MEKDNRRLFGMLGFAMRAGKLVLGTELICRALPKGGVKLVAVSATASAATRKKLFTKCEFYGASAAVIDIDTERLGELLGKTHPVAAVATTDEGFAAEIRKAAEQGCSE